MNNPFKPADTTVSAKIKVLLYGPSGSGKTLAALSAPGVAVIDSEAGTDLYRGRVAAFQVLRIKALSELENALKFVEQDNGKSLQTLVIDPVTVFYDVLKNTASANNTKDLGFREWGRINNQMQALYTRLAGLPVHVIVTARESVEYETKGSSINKVGVKPDCDKKLPYLFDFVIRLQADHSGIVEKSRGFNLPQHLPRVDWSVFTPVLEGTQSGERLQTLKSDAATAEDEADNMASEDVAGAFWSYWQGQGMTASDVREALGVQKATDYKKGRKAADEAMSAYVNSHVIGGAA